MKLIKYNMIGHVNIGTEESPIWEVKSGASVVIQCSAENLEANEEIAKGEAYLGMYTIEDVPDTVESIQV